MFPIISLESILQQAKSKTPSPLRRNSIAFNRVTLSTHSNRSTTSLTEAEPLPPYSATTPRYEFPAETLFPIQEETVFAEPPRGRLRQQRPPPYRATTSADDRPLRPFPFTNLKTLERVAKASHAAEKAAIGTKTKGEVTREVGARYGQADADKEKELEKLGDIWAGLDEETETETETEFGKENGKH